MSICAVCKQSYDRIKDGDDYVCSECRGKHDANKRKKEDDELLLRFASAACEPFCTDNQDAVANYAKQSFDLAEAMLAEYRKRRGFDE